eukprot:752407-Alexandrium_andersonii.AAC.1
MKEVTKLRWAFAKNRSLDDAKKCDVTPNCKRGEAIMTKGLSRRNSNVAQKPRLQDIQWCQCGVCGMGNCSCAILDERQNLRLVQLDEFHHGVVSTSAQQCAEAPTAL